MTTKRTRKRYPDSIKQEVLRLADETWLNYTEIARKTKVNRGTVWDWINRRREDKHLAAQTKVNGHGKTQAQTLIASMRAMLDALESQL